MQWMLLPYRRYFDFAGRSRRKEYWMFTLLSVIVSAVFIILMGLGGGFAGMDESGLPDMAAVNPLFWLAVVVFLLWALASIIPSIALTVRRLHDRNITGWLYLGFVIVQFIPVVGLIASIALLVLMVLPGTVGSNKYGVDPKDPSQAEVFA